VTKEGQLTHEQEHHQHVASATNKATEGISVELSNLSYIKPLLNLIMWVRSYRTKNLTRFGGVGHMPTWATC
jgi:hypothetical protein